MNREMPASHNGLQPNPVSTTCRMEKPGALKIGGATLLMWGSLAEPPGVEELSISNAVLLTK